MNKQFESKVALVTGGNTGIGQGIALAFAKAGAKVVVSARRVAQGEETIEMIKASGGEATFVKGDISKTADVKNIIATCIDLYGGLDFLVNNAGISGPPPVPTADYSEEDWDKVIDTNLKGVFLCMKYSIPEILKRGNGSIVNISSVSGLRGGMVGSGYYASKHGVIGLTKAAAFEYASKGLRVNAVCPAMTETEMTKPFLAHSEELTEQLKSQYPLGRFGLPDDVAATVMWLCSDGASFITGQSHPVDGGRLIA